MSQQTSIAICSLSCRFPDAASPTELWQNAMEGRRSFRAIPKQRLDLEQYADHLLGEADSIVPVKAGLLTGWEFDRARFRVPIATFEATDLAHWLALELASDAISKVGLDRLDRSRTAVVVANTLTGEFSRAAMLRHRLPFLDTMLANAVETEGLESTVGERLRQAFGQEIRGRFPAPNEDSLAGGLANTIAGRIANHFDLRGGAYTVDGACASSLVAIADAANLLATRQADAVIVGAVDLSIDPFELIGFSRNGALARDEMRVFDARSAGFWPGEGGAFVVLVRNDEAQRRGLDPLAVLRGWGLSTDGAGGMTRPSQQGQLTAYLRAYEGADADPMDLAFAEAHGTGTAVGDPLEIRALADLRAGAVRPLAIGSIKANIGHTKAAAGMAGLVKTVEALRHGLIPPHVGCGEPHPAFAGTEGLVEPLLNPRQLDGHLAGVSSFGFGGINSHIVLERAGVTRSAPIFGCSLSFFDAELFIFAGDPGDVIGQLELQLARAPSLSISELMDASAAALKGPHAGRCRVAVVASNSRQLADRLAVCLLLLRTGRTQMSRETGVFVGEGVAAPRIGFMFPGQGAPSNPTGGLWARCFTAAAEFCKRLPTSPLDCRNSTEIAQPTIVASSMAALALLNGVGIKGELAIGHSLGEISALSWAGALSWRSAVDLAATRGAIMAKYATTGGRMMRVALPDEELRELLQRVPDLDLACDNSVNETVVAGPRGAIERLGSLLQHRKIEHSVLTTSHAFHSRAMRSVVVPFSAALEDIELVQCSAPVISTVIGRQIEPDDDLRTLLADQLVRRVRLRDALMAARERLDLMIEVGPGEGISRLIRNAGLHSLPVDAYGDSLAPLLLTLAELHARGCDLNVSPLFERRSPRFLELSPPLFLSSPCGENSGSRRDPVPSATPDLAGFDEGIRVPAQGDTLSAVLGLIASQTGLPLDAIGQDDRFLDSLHLNSLSVSRIVVAAARATRTRTPAMPTEFANATPRMLADALDEIRGLGREDPDIERVAGVRPWVDTYGLRWSNRVQPHRRAGDVTWEVLEGRQADLPSDFPASAEGLLIRLGNELSCMQATQLVLLAAEAARRKIPNLAIVHTGAPVSAFARSLALEAAFERVTVIRGEEFSDLGDGLRDLLSLETGRYTELLADAQGKVSTPEFVPVEPVNDDLIVGPDDVVLAIGGGHGIASECALELGRRGARLILVGRSPAADEEVAATLERAVKRGVSCAYVSADACDIRLLEASLAPAIGALGVPTVLIHAAGVNEPQHISRIARETAHRCLSTKMVAFENAVSLFSGSLRKVITFGSAIGRIGLQGEAHYALGNEALSLAATRWANELPGRSSLALEWSVWGGMGMGERLGTIERLSSLGVDPISVDDALAAFNDLIEAGATGTVAVVSRFGCPPDLDRGCLELPSLRFVDRPLVHYPAKEVVIETELARGRDRYLDDHSLSGQRLLPGAMALEAMAQAARCLSEAQICSIQNIHFDRAIQLEKGTDTRVRLAALKTGNQIESALFIADDGFRSPAVRARFVCGSLQSADPTIPSIPLTSTVIDARPFYGNLFFNSGKFARLDQYSSISSRRIVATIAPADQTQWYGSFESQVQTLWDPGAVDACLHALQAAVPHRRVLPTSVDRIELYLGGAPARIEGVEREIRSNAYVFDLTVEDSEGRMVQRWTGATFKAVEELDCTELIEQHWALAAPFLERTARERLGDDSIRLVLLNGETSSRGDRREAAFALLDVKDHMDRRADGRRVNLSGGSVTVSHSDNVTLVVSSTNIVGCDIEQKTAGDGRHKFAAHEALRKLGRRLPAHLINGLVRNEIMTIDDVTVLVLEVPEQLGFSTIAFTARKERSRSV